MRGLLYTKLKNLSLAGLVVASLLMTGCGFHPRGMSEVTFKTISIQGNSLSMSRELRQTLKSNGIKVIEHSDDDALLFEMMNESNEKRILSLSGGGTVREYELVYKVSFRTRLPNSPLWSEAQTVQSRRNFSYDDKALLAKLDEENKLNADMHSEVVREIMRRLSAIKRLQP
jgi:LPS-assembly lipoprotein